jgi:hypothetical protein
VKLHTAVPPGVKEKQTGFFGQVRQSLSFDKNTTK